jgi:hypothetical protein
MYLTFRKRWWLWLFNSLHIAAFQWPITSSITLTYILLNYCTRCLQDWTMFCCPRCSHLSTILNNIVEPESGVAILFNIVDNCEQCGQHNIVQSCFHQYYNNLIVFSCVDYFIYFIFMPFISEFYDNCIYIKYKISFTLVAELWRRMTSLGAARLFREFSSVTAGGVTWPSEVVTLNG